MAAVATLRLVRRFILILETFDCVLSRMAAILKLLKDLKHDR
jgi:hypothetical protein